MSARSRYCRHGTGNAACTTRSSFPQSCRTTRSCSGSTAAARSIDNTVSQITFLGARLKTPLPTPNRQTNVYWLGDTLTALPFDQWKLEISLQTLSRPNKTANTALTVIFSAAIVTRTNS